MIFKRRDKRLTLGRLKEYFLPKKGWKRALEYIVHRLKRIPDSPHKISVGVSMGIFASFTPLYGLHFLLAGVLAYIFNGNILAAIIGTFILNPVTWPVITSASVNFGEVIMGRSLSDFETFLDHFVGVGKSILLVLGSVLSGVSPDWSRPENFWNEIFLPYLIGGTILGLLAGLISYFICRPVIYAYKIARKKKKFKRVTRTKKIERNSLNEQY